LECCAQVERLGRDRRQDVSGGVGQHAPPLQRGGDSQRAGAGRAWVTRHPWRAVRCVCSPSTKGSAQRNPLVELPVRSPPLRVDTSFHRLSVAALQPEGQHLTLRHGPARQVHSDYSHYAPRRAAGMVGSLPRCISPSCCPRLLPLDQSATIGNLCINPNRMRPLQIPFARSMLENVTSGRGSLAHWGERFFLTSHPFCLIRNLLSSHAVSNIHTSGAPFQPLTVV
jgi:hypothetical protein